MKSLEESYRQALEQAIREYEHLSKERARIDERLAQLIQTMGSLSRLCRLTPSVQLGLTDACRVVLKSAARPLSAAEIRERLAFIGFDVCRYANPLASIHTVLRRLCRSGEAAFTPRASDRPAFAWKPPVRIIAIKANDTDRLKAWMASMPEDPPEGEP